MKQLKDFISKFLKDFRAQSYLKQEEAAKLLETTHRTYIKWENGQVLMPPHKQIEARRLAFRNFLRKKAALINLDIYRFEESGNLAHRVFEDVWSALMEGHPFRAMERSERIRLESHRYPEYERTHDIWIRDEYIRALIIEHMSWEARQDRSVEILDILYTCERKEPRDPGLKYAIQIDRIGYEYSAANKQFIRTENKAHFDNQCRDWIKELVELHTSNPDSQSLWNQAIIASAIRDASECIRIRNEIMDQEFKHPLSEVRNVSKNEKIRRIELMPELAFFRLAVKSDPSGFS